MITASLRRLEVFKAVVEAGRLSGAATTLSITQPSVTAHVKSLEQEVGQRLLLRGPGRQLRLTEAGRVIYAYATEAVALEDRTTVALRTLDRRQSTQLVVAVQSALTHEPLPMMLAEFLLHRPDIKLLLRSGTNDEILDLLRRNRVQCGIFFSLGSLDNIESEIIGREQFIFVVAPSHPLAARPSVTPREMAEYGFIGGLSTSNFNHLLLVMLRRVGIRQPQIIMEVQDPRAVNDLARHGLGISGNLISRTLDSLKNGSLVPVRLDMPPTYLEVRWAYSSRQPIPKSVNELLRHIKRRRVFDVASSWPLNR